MNLNLNLKKIAKKILRENFLMFFFSFAVIFGPTYALFDSYDYNMETNPDIKTYLGLANYDFDQSPIRKYRVIVPFVASAVNKVCNPVFSKLSPESFPGPDFSLCMSFLIVNTFIMALFGLMVYKLCRINGASFWASVIGLLSVLTSRWTAYFSGIPVVDSLFLLIVASTIYAIQTKNFKLQILIIFIGPWVKEPFLFIAPLIFFFSHIKKWKLVTYFLLSGILVFSYRYLYDKYLGVSVDLGLSSDMSHLNNLGRSLRRLFSFHGFYEIVSVLGLWFLIFSGLIKKEIRLSVKEKTPLLFIVFIFLVFVQVIISSDVARMFYIATPILAIWIALIVEKLMKMVSIS